MKGQKQLSKARSFYQLAGQNTRKLRGKTRCGSARAWGFSLSHGLSDCSEGRWIHHFKSPGLAILMLNYN